MAVTTHSPPTERAGSPDGASSLKQHFLHGDSHVVEPLSGIDRTVGHLYGALWVDLNVIDIVPGETDDLLLLLLSPSPSLSLPLSSPSPLTLA